MAIKVPVRTRLDGIQIINPWKNFRGEKKKFNERGDRTFNLSFLSPNDETAIDLLNAGWPVKEQIDDSGEVFGYQMQVKVNYGSTRPPQIHRVSPFTGRRELLTVDNIASLDGEDIEYVNIIFNPYNWHVSGDEGVTAYVEQMDVYIRENEFDLEWEVQNASLRGCTYVDGTLEPGKIYICNMQTGEFEVVEE
jgi:hypothetical protein